MAQSEAAMMKKSNLGFTLYLFCVYNSQFTLYSEEKTEESGFFSIQFSFFSFLQCNVNLFVALLPPVMKVHFIIKIRNIFSLLQLFRIFLSHFVARCGASFFFLFVLIESVNLCPILTFVIFGVAILIETFCVDRRIVDTN